MKIISKLIIINFDIIRFDTVDVVIYNFFSALLTIDTNIKQFVTIYYIFSKNTKFFRNFSIF